MTCGNSLRVLTVGVLALLPFVTASADDKDAPRDARPNILFAIADDWGWPHAGTYGDAVVQTPSFDRIASEGVLFNHAYVSSPSCTPSRSAILTGQYHWRLESAANLWSIFPDRFATYPEMLQAAGYAVGFTGKGWGPGRMETKGRTPVGPRFKGFDDFLGQRPKGKPFAFWLGTSDPHRPFKRGSGAAAGMDLASVHMYGHYPNAPEVRGDVADYYVEVQRFDRLVGAAMAALEEMGELENTIIVMTGDHGMPFPRGKSNLYDSGTRVPLAVRWGEIAKGGRVVDDFVSLTDLAPTFLEAIGLTVPDEMTGRSLVSILTSEKQGRIDEVRSFVLTGKERHVPAQEAPDRGGYPCRAIRTHDYLYIMNFRPDRWPAGTPHYEKATIPGAWLADCDNGPTKMYIVENREKDDAHRRAHELCFGKRPGEELYDLRADPDQLQNVADDPAYAEVKAKLSSMLRRQLRATGDPRITMPEKAGAFFEEHPYFGRGPRHPDWTPPAEP